LNIYKDPPRKSTKYAHNDNVPIDVVHLHSASKNEGHNILYT